MRKKTLRRLNPDARAIAKLADEVLSTGRRLRNLAIKLNDRRIIEYLKNR